MSKYKQLNKEEYKEIRNKPNFLYLYFIECGGKRIPEQQFQQELNIWIQITTGQTPTIGRRTIENYLDIQQSKL